MAKIFNSNNFVLTTTAQNNIHIAAANCGVDEVEVGAISFIGDHSILPVYDSKKQVVLFCYNLTLDKVQLPN